MTADETGRVGLAEASLQKRLRQLLALIADAPRDCTSEGDDQGSWSTSVDFVGADLIDRAQTLLDEWDDEGAGRAALTDSATDRRGEK